MSQPTSFGRRHSPPSPPAAHTAAVEDFSPEAEAFRRQLAAQSGRGGSDFAAWRRAQTPHRALAWLLGLVLMAPGLICFAIDAPWTVSAGLELAGGAVNWWLRRERRRHLLAIISWDAEQAQI